MPSCSPLISFLLLRHTDVYPPVALAPFLGRIVSYRVLFAVAFGIQTCNSNTQFDEPLFGVLRALLGKLQVIGIVIHVVRVPADPEPEV